MTIKIPAEEFKTFDDVERTFLREIRKAETGGFNDLAYSLQVDMCYYQQKARARREFDND